MATEASGDWTLRGLDFETYLVGQITDKIIDADRIVRAEWANGFPNWALYRTILAGDTNLLQGLRAWCVAYAIAYAEGATRKGLPADEIGCLAGWDAYYRMLHGQWVIAGHDIADVAGVDPKTYRKVRNHVHAALNASLWEYFVRLQVAVRQVWMRDRWIEAEAPRGRWASGSGFGEALDPAGDGCYVVRKATMSDNLH